MFGIMDFSYNKSRALVLWKERLETLKTTGNFMVMGDKFFSEKYTIKEKIAYVEKMINENTEADVRSKQSQDS